MKARGKREAQRNASPLVTKKYLNRALKARNTNVNYSAPSELHGYCSILPGATRLTLFGACPWLSYFAPSALSIFRAFGAQHIPRLWRLACPGFHIPRLRRLPLAFIFRAFGACLCFIFRALALASGFHDFALWRLAYFALWRLAYFAPSALSIFRAFGA